LAIVQISQITNRKGLNIDLPQLAGAEFGWSTDTRQLYIGNGTLAEGAPVIGNTEILTEFSDILNINSAYTYKGTAAGYTVQTGSTPGTPVTLSLQNWLDQWASVLDFGATGDGITDDTAAINRALYQLYCREVNPQIRRSLFFPAGVYRVTGSINIPPYATLYGEGSDNSIISLDVGANDYVVRTADSLQNTGVNIGLSGATPPQYITITNLGFTNLDPTGNVCLVQDATNCRFQNVGFRGTSTTTDLETEANGSIGVSFASTNSIVCDQITFDGCVFSGLVWGITTTDQTKAVTVSTSNFNTLYKGIVLGENPTTNGGPTGTRIVGNMFDTIFAEGIVFGTNLSTGINASGHNIFYDVGNHFSGSLGTPYTSIIDIQSNNNVSISDLFERTDDFSIVYPRINVNATVSIATTNGSLLTMGTYNRTSGKHTELVNNTTGTVLSTSTDIAKAFTVNYTITRAVLSPLGTAYRTGTIMVATNSDAADLTWNDEYLENVPTGISLSVSQVGTTVSVNYTSTNSGVNGTISYSVTSLI
jgi:Pectate lyase superfamily protein